MKMRERNEQLKRSLGAIAPKETVQEINDIPVEDTVNRQGFKAYSLDDELKLVSMLNTLKIEPQFYRSESEQMKDLRDLIERIAMKDPYFVAQAIVWSRCLGEGMRSINHLAAALLAPFIKGLEWNKRFYGAFDKKHKKGGCIFRLDDMSEIKDAYYALGQKSLSAPMRKGFASVLENADTYQLSKYKKTTIDISNLVHPDSKKSNAVVGHNSEIRKVLDLIMQGVNVTADTWESAQSEAGQEVAKAVKEGKLTEKEAEKVLAEAKADNWESLLREGKLGVLAALRNIRNIMKNPRAETINMWCELIKDPIKTRKALILPIHFDLAYDVVNEEFGEFDYTNQVKQALQDGYQNAIPNLAEIFTGRTLVVIDRSGSMNGGCVLEGSKGWNPMSKDTSRCSYKAGLIAATICKATGADVIKFGSNANYVTYNQHKNVFALARELGQASWDSTNPAAVFDLIRYKNEAYDRIIFISDNEVNGKLTSIAYKNYIHDVCSPYIYGIDLAAYGTTPLKGDKVRYFCGYGPSLYESIKQNEFNAVTVIDEIRKLVI